MCEPVGECHPLAVIAYSRRRPTWHMGEEAGRCDGKASFFSTVKYMFNFQEQAHVNVVT